MTDSDTNSPANMTPNGLPATVIPSSGLSDTVALLCVLLACPPWLSCLILLLYAISASSRAMGGKLFAKVLKKQSGFHNDSLFVTQSQDEMFSRYKKRFSDFLGPLLLAFLIDGLLALMFRVFLPGTSKLTNILAKALIASTLVGSAKSSLTNALISTVLIIILDHSITNLTNSVIDYFELHFHIPTNISIMSSHYNSPIHDFLVSTDSDFHVSLMKLLHYLNNSTSFLYSILSIHTILIGVLPTSQGIFLLKDWSVKLDQLSNLDDNLATYNKKKSNLTPLASSTLQTTNSISSIYPTSSSSEQQPEIPVISVSPDIAESPLPLRSPVPNNDFQDNTPASYPSVTYHQEISNSASVVAANFENFCISPFSTGSASNLKKSNNRLANVTSSQPFWSLIAAARTMLSRPDVFAGDEKDSKAMIKWNHVKNVTAFISYIGDTSIGLQVCGFHFANLRVIVNDIAWHQVFDGINDQDTFIMIHSLTPLSQYNIEILDYVNEELLVSTICVSTKSNDGNVLNETKSTSALITLQQSLMTMSESLTDKKAILKKTRRDNTKRVNNLKTEIETLKSKISKSSGSDERNVRKKTALRTTVKQFEVEVVQIEAENLDISKQEEDLYRTFEIDRSRLESQIRELKKFLGGHAESINKIKDEIKILEAERDHVQNKCSKLTSKRMKNLKELKKAEKELKNLKNFDIKYRLEERQKRSKRRDKLMNAFMEEIENFKKELDRNGNGVAVESNNH